MKIILVIVFFLFIVSTNNLNDEYVIKNLFKALENEKEVKFIAPFTNVSLVETRNIGWKRCVNINVIGNTCIELYAIVREVKVGVRLIIGNKVIFDQSFGGNKICLGDKELLQLILDIPALKPFKKIIDELM
jgi:hypothetical protein